VAGSCEHDNEPSGSITSGEFLGKLSDRQLLKKQSAPKSLLTKGTCCSFLGGRAPPSKADVKKTWS
jgi:hypothetical protein